MQQPNLAQAKIDRSAFSVATLTERSNDLEFWLGQTPAARFRAMELMRQINYGDAASGRLQRLLEVAQLERR